MADEREYILGTGADELNRLGIQHRVWADAAVAAWKAAGISPGANVLDLGCGPGHATFDLAQLITESGKVIGADASQRFVNHLNEQSKLRGLPQLSANVVDAENLPATFTPNRFDYVYCRWLLCWLNAPEKALAGIHAVLKKNGKVIIHDYFNWQSMTTGPRSEAIEAMVRAALSSFKESGGDIDIAARLPQLLTDAGFVLKQFDVHQRVARGGGVDGTIAWPLTWWRSYGPKLVEMGKLASSDYKRAADDMAAVEKDSNRFFVCPPVYEFIAEKI